MDRKQNNDRLREIVDQHRDTRSGAIPVPGIAPMTDRLIALLDELVDAAYGEGERDAVDRYPEMWP